MVEVLRPKEFVEEYCIRSLVCCFSGGKDSLVATHYVLSELEDVDIVKYVDTTVMIPIAIDYVKKVSRCFGWNLKILRPNPDFWALAEKWGCPTMNRRWCCYHLKLKPIFEFVRDLVPQRAMVTGLRREESKRRQKLPQVYFRKKPYAWSYAPIIDWTEKQVLTYIKEHDLPMPPHYRVQIPETCVCGAFTNKKTMMIIKAQFPELFKKFLELEKRFKSGGAAFYFNNKPTYARDLTKQKTLLEVIN